MTSWSLQNVTVFTAWLLASLWLASAFYFPDWLRGEEGINELICHIAVNMCLLCFGIFLCLRAGVGQSSFMFAISVLMAPLFHLIGSATELPVCLVFFVAPSLIIFYVGYLEIKRNSNGISY